MRGPLLGGRRPSSSPTAVTMRDSDTAPGSGTPRGVLAVRIGRPFRGRSSAVASAATRGAGRRTATRRRGSAAAIDRVGEGRGERHEGVAIVLSPISALP